MKLYNTLSRKKETLKPLDAGKIKLYTCGPTVYDYAQIGNLRAFTFYDTLRRTLESVGLKVNHVMNITDVGHLVSDADEGEDKLEKGAKREGKSVWDVAEFYIQAFKQDASALNHLKPTQLIRATDAIKEQVDLVQALVAKGFAYQTEQAIYFDVTKLKDYGKLSGQKLEDKEVGARDEVVTDPAKHHPQDFALWFFTVGRYADHQMHWPSPWGDGFPGWHLECSAIVHKTLGEPIDIHTGGVDHIGTHHANEIAQSEAAYGQPLANLWMHNEFLLVDGQKMSKSLGNFYTLKDVTDKGFSPMVLRLLYLQAHYRSQQNFTWEALKAAQNSLLNIYAWADRQFQGSKELNTSKALNTIRDHLADDLDTPKALAELYKFIDESNKSDARPNSKLLGELEALLGLSLEKRNDISPDQKKLINDREAARSNKDFEMADKLRKELADQGLEIEDTAHGARWRRTVL